MLGWRGKEDGGQKPRDRKEKISGAVDGQEEKSTVEFFN